MGRTFIILFKIQELIFHELFLSRVPPIPPKFDNGGHLSLFGSLPKPPVSSKGEPL
jgi:hypothetical protein